MAEKKENTEKRANEVLDVILAYAKLDFKPTLKISKKGDVMDAIATGVNMLGEELQSASGSLKEKEELLREVHHRVKNNMQVISSLLSLVLENHTDKKVVTVIKDSQNRIRSMAIIHELLYTKSDFKQTNLAEYVKNLTGSLYYSYAPPKSDITFDIDVDKAVTFDIDTMVPLGLILNEIICNSLKHAFPKQKGKITIHLSKTKTRCELIVADNGAGFPKGFKKENSKTLGVQLIDILSEQLQAKTTFKSSAGKGTEYVLVCSL